MITQKMITLSMMKKSQKERGDGARVESIVVVLPLAKIRE
jgi:hypothetical protein